MKRFLTILMTLFLALTLTPAHSATVEEEPARSGTIVSGLSGLHHDALIGCEMAPDCRAWLAHDCDPALTGRDPALSASIEDVAGLAAVSPVWIFEHAPGAAAYAAVQFWRTDCTEIRRARWGSGECKACSLNIPASARWMTVTGYTYNPWAVWPPIPHTSGPLTLNWVLRQR
ncbi:MAG: hypothetical protein M3N53_07975 [Actinomycetota bacterium]|nr:hypothetical protein [Actinomycetota bacterium]